MRLTPGLRTAAAAVLVSLSALVLAIVTAPAQAAQVIITIVYDNGAFHPAQAQAPYHSFVRWTNDSGLQLTVQSTSTNGVCDFTLQIDAFTTSEARGPFSRNGRCDYRGTTVLSSTAATIQITGGPTSTPSSTPSPRPSATPSQTSRPSGSPSPGVSASPQTSGQPSPAVSPTASPSSGAGISTTEGPTPTAEATGPPPPSPSAGPRIVAGADLRDQGRRTIGLPGALAALAVAALFGALARVLSAEAAR